ncbi:MAG: 2-nitropropane dioxygenase [Blastocatellia bacterium]
MARLTIFCPCCEASIVIDRATGVIISFEEKKKPLASFDELKSDLEKQKEIREQIFAQEMSSLKDRERLLDEKFKEALKRAEGDDKTPFKNPLDLD